MFRWWLLVAVVRYSFYPAASREPKKKKEIIRNYVFSLSFFLSSFLRSGENPSRQNRPLFFYPFIFFQRSLRAPQIMKAFIWKKAPTRLTAPRRTYQFSFFLFFRFIFFSFGRSVGRLLARSLVFFSSTQPLFFCCGTRVHSSREAHTEMYVFKKYTKKIERRRNPSRSQRSFGGSFREGKKRKKKRPKEE